MVTFCNHFDGIFPEFDAIFSLFARKNFWAKPFDSRHFLCYSYTNSQAVTKTWNLVRRPERSLLAGMALRTALFPTTSEPPGGNAGTGAPVIASMSGGVCPQPGWNRGILFVSHP